MTISLAYSNFNPNEIVATVNYIGDYQYTFNGYNGDTTEILITQSHNTLDVSSLNTTHIIYFNVLIFDNGTNNLSNNLNNVNNNGVGATGTVQRLRCRQSNEAS